MNVSLFYKSTVLNASVVIAEYVARPQRDSRTKVFGFVSKRTAKEM